MQFNPNGDYKTEFEHAVTAIKDEKIEDRPQRIRKIDDLIEEYVTATGERPDDKQLERLTNEILREELTDKNEYKMSQEPEPILSDRQQERRHDTEVPESAGQFVGTDGMDYRYPLRKKRHWTELMDMDKRQLKRK